MQEINIEALTREVTVLREEGASNYAEL